MDRKEQAKALILSGETIATVANRLQLSRRTVERWMRDGDWRSQRQQMPATEKPPKVVPIRSPKPIPESTHPPIRDKRSPGEINDLEIVELAISDLSAAMAGSSEDVRSLGSLAGGLCKLIELRRKISPPTAADLAEQVAAIGITPAEFIRELKERWATG